VTAGEPETGAVDGALEAAARSHAYRLFADAFGYPQGELLARIRSGELADALAEALFAVSPPLGERLESGPLREAGPGDALAVEYTRLFDVGPGGPPCPLHGGLWIGDRMKTMEEVLRFYRHFGLALADSPRELPDHLSIELEFLHYLAYREAEALAEGGDPGPYRRAQHDFASRHAARFAPLLRARLERENAAPFYVALARGLESLLAHAPGGPISGGSARLPVDARP
jgi:DMSO reductase family type II enzyme chaperone